MRFCEAIEIIRENKKAITRDIWENRAIVRFKDNNMLEMTHYDGSRNIWQIGTMDFIADDYRVVEGFLNEAGVSDS